MPQNGSWLHVPGNRCKKIRLNFFIAGNGKNAPEEGGVLSF
jgi:hypothetical protein